MKNIFLTLLIFSVSLFADLKEIYPTQDFFSKKIPIVDIRTPQEWQETGILQGAVPIMFFDQNGRYNVDKFLQQLNKKVDTSKPFAIICRTGHRTSMVAPWLGNTLKYKVINLKGGMLYVTQKLKIPTHKYVSHIQ